MHYLTQDEIKQLLREIPKQRQRLMLKVGFLHGLRVSEIVNLRKESIQGGFIQVQRLKGSLKTTQAYIKHPDPELDEAKELTALYKVLKPGEILFNMTRFGVYKLIQRAGKKAGLPLHKLHPHVLKHSCAKLGITAMPIDQVRQYLGHKNMNSTAQYLKADDEEATKAFAGIFK